jgi:hypothetical protein
VIQISRDATRLTSLVIRFPDAFGALSIGDSAQHLALAPHRTSIKANRMEYAELPTKRSVCVPTKIISEIIFGVSQKTKTPLDRSGVHIV